MEQDRTDEREHVRAGWTGRWPDEIVQDVRYALRTLRRSPGFTLVAVLTIALGIGANTAIFWLVNAAMLQPLGYPQPRRLMSLTTRFADGKPGSFSPAEYWELADINQSFSVVGAFLIGEVNLSAQDRPRRTTQASVNAELLEALAVPPERGRWFRRDETRDGGPALVILSHRLWQSAFGAREDVIGQRIEIDGVAREVIGIMPAGYDLIDKRVELWLPLQLAPALRQFRASHFLSVLGRLKSGVSEERAGAELASLVATWGERVGVRGHVFTPGEHPIQMEPVRDEVVGSARRAFWLLQAGVGLVLLIACANLANLLMVRAEIRGREVAIRKFAGLALVLAAIGTYGVLSYIVTQQRREIGIRMALGAERALVLRGVMGHGMKLTCAGLAAGLAGALLLTRVMQTLLFEVRPSDPATLAGVAALIAAVSAVASLVPAVRATRVDPMVALRDE